MIKQKFKKEAVLFAVLTFIYFLSVNLANKLSVTVGIPHSINALTGMIFSAAVIICLKKKKPLTKDSKTPHP